jgi:invasion protein IalB
MQMHMQSICKFVRGVAVAIFAFIPATQINAQQPASKPAPQRPAQATPTVTATPAGSAAPSAQPPVPQVPVAQPSASSAPQRTTATYDDWIVQCETQAGSPPRKLCEMTQLTQLQVQGKTQPFSRIVVPQPVKGMPSGLVVQVPVNVAFVTKVKIQTSDSDQGIEVPFARCVPDGCFAEFSVAGDGLARLRMASTGGKLSFADSTGRTISIPLSFNGFGKAYDALIKE